jgi:hypothetical protein
MSDGWPVSPTAQQGLDPELICSTGPDLASPQEAAPHGVVVIRRGVLVYVLLRQRQSLNLVVAVTAGLYRASNGGPPVAESLAGDLPLNSFVLPAAICH